MEISMELWDIYDIDHIKTGRSIERNQKKNLKPGEFHLVVEICVFSPDGKMLIQKRTAQKLVYPGLWAWSAGGSAILGENSREAAERELFEEIGIKQDFTGELPCISVPGKTFFHDYYCIIAEPQLTELKLQAEEVDEVCWASKEEILAKIKSGTFIPVKESFVSFLFDCYKDKRI